MESEAELDAQLAQPGESLTQMMTRLDGDIMILGVGWKMGLSLGALAVNAIREAGVTKDVIGV